MTGINLVIPMIIVGVVLVVIIVVLAVMLVSRRKASKMLAQEVLPSPADSSPVESLVVKHSRIASHLAYDQVEVLDLIEQTAEDPDLLFQIFAARHLAAQINFESEMQQVFSGKALDSSQVDAKKASDVARAAMEAATGFENVRLQIVEDSVILGECLAGMTNLLTQLINRATESERYSRVRVKVSVSEGRAVYDIIDRGGELSDEQMAKYIAQIQNGMNQAPAEEGLWAVGAVIRTLPVEVRFSSGGEEGNTTATVIAGSEAMGSEEDLAIISAPIPIVTSRRSLRADTSTGVKIPKLTKLPRIESKSFEVVEQPLPVPPLYQAAVSKMENRMSSWSRQRGNS